MKSVIITISLFLIIFTLQSFNSEPSVTVFMADTSTINPNGSSELSLLMRDMQAYTNTAKASLQSKAKPQPYPKNFDKIYTAKISDGMSKSDFYKQFADLYITAVKNYSTSSPAQRAETYNNMVSGCLACHSQHCPGPVPVIKKMVWDPE